MQKANWNRWIGTVIGGAIGFLFNSFIPIDYKEIAYLNFVAFGLIIGLIIRKYSELAGFSIFGALSLGLVETYEKMGTRHCFLLGGCSDISPLYGFFYSIIGGAIGGAIAQIFSDQFEKEIKSSSNVGDYFIGIFVLGGAIGAIVGTMLMFANKILIGISTFIPYYVFILSAFGHAIGMHFDNMANKNSQKRQQYLQTVPGLFDTAKSLTSQATALFQQKNYPSALQTYENALTHFACASEGAKALSDTTLANSISNNISAIQTNITACKNAIGAETASKARSKFEKGDFTGAIQTYEESLKYFQEPELISKTKANIENCYIEIDARKVEELSAQAVSLLKEAAALNEPFKAIEKLNQADNMLNEAVSLATKRKFTTALSQLNDISKSIRNKRDIVHKSISNEQVISEKYDIESVTPVTAPTIPAAGHSNQLEFLREYEFFNGFIRMKLSLKNRMQHTITDVSLDLELNENILRLDHYEPYTYTIKKEKIQLGNIAPDNDGTIALYLDPLICTKGTDVKCRIDYKDSYGKPDSVRMEPLRIPVVCPVFQTEQDINIGRLKELVDLLAHGSKVFSLSKGVGIGEAMTLCREVIQMHDVRHVRTFKTTDGNIAETWYYGKTKVEKKDIVIKASVRKETESIEVFVAAPDQKALTGLLGELGRNLRERGESLGKLAPVVNLTIRGSIIQRSSLLNFCDMNGICGANVVIEDSLVQRSNIVNNKL